MTTTAAHTPVPGQHSDRPYGELLRVEPLLAVAHVRTGPIDTQLFLVSHQVYEIWFAMLISHLESARAALLAHRTDEAEYALSRLPAVVRVLMAQLDLLATLDADGFEDIRATLGTASGFQSAQFHEVEYLCGLRDERRLRISGLSEAERARLAARLVEPSVADAYDRLRAARPPGDRAVRGVAAALLDFDEAVVVWRARHAALAERFIGGRPGTGGTGGASYLWLATRRRLFPSAWPHRPAADTTGEGAARPCAGES